MSQLKGLAKRCQSDPGFFAWEVLGVRLWAKQEEVLYSIRDNPSTIVVSCNAAGKTFVSAVGSLWFLYTHPPVERGTGALVVTTAPTQRQIKNVLWAEIARLWAGAKVPLGGELMSTELMVDRAYKWMAMGVPASEEVRFQGLHNDDLLIIFDEAAGVAPPIYTAAQGNLVNPQRHKFLLIGNPTSPSGMFYEYSKNPNWHKIQISAYDSPAILEPEKYPFLVSQRWIEERKTEWGETSPMYIARVLGQFPEEGDDTLIPLSWVMDAVKRFQDDPQKCVVSERRFFGLDVARYGTNKTVLTQYVPHRVEKVLRHQGKDLMAAVHLVARQALDCGDKLMLTTLDDTGAGGGVTDRLRELQYNLLPINFSASPHDKVHFMFVRDEMYWVMRELFRSGEIAIPNDDRLISQLSSIKYKIDERQRVRVETKDEMTKRGIPSPDDADSLALAIYGSRRMHGSSITRRVAGRVHVPEETTWY